MQEVGCVLIACQPPSHFFPQSTGGADLFIGYGGVIERSSVVTEADWYIYDHMDLLDSFVRLKVRSDLDFRCVCSTAL